MPTTDLLNPVTPVLGGAVLSSANAMPVKVISGGASGITVDSTAITGGTTTRLLYDNGATVGETVGVTYASATAAVGMTGVLSMSAALNFIGDGAFNSATATVQMYRDSNHGLAMVMASGAINDFNLLTPGGAAFLVTVPHGTNTVALPSVGAIAFLSSAAAADVGISRVAAASLAVGTGAQGNIAGTILSSSAVLTGTLRYGGVTLASTVTGTGSMVLGTGPSFSSASTVTYTAGGTITYGGVTLSSTVTGTGSMVLSASPTLSGTASFAATVHSGTATFSSGVTANATITSTISSSAASAPMITGSQTWNNSAVAFSGIDISIINTASNASSRVFNLIVNSSSVFAVNSSGTLLGNAIQMNSSSLSGALNISGTGKISMGSATAVAAGGSTSFGYFMSTTATLGTICGSGAPTVAAAQGALYLRSDGSSTASRLYVATSSSGAWTNVTTAA